MKPLLVIFQFRQIPEFLDSVNFNIDKLWMKFYPQRDAYRIARDWFLNSDYTHFILLTDDVVVTQKDIDTLIDARVLGVVSGWFNGNTTTHRFDSNISWNLPPNPPYKGTYEDYRFVPIDELQAKFPTNRSCLVQVKHQGTALTLLSRDIVRQIPFRHSEGCCIDACLALDLAKAGIPQYVDLIARCKHLKINDENQAVISKVGIEKPEQVFEENTG